MCVSLLPIPPLGKAFTMRFTKLLTLQKEDQDVEGKMNFWSWSSNGSVGTAPVKMLSSCWGTRNNVYHFRVESAFLIGLPIIVLVVRFKPTYR